MTMGPEPMIRIFLMSSRRGTDCVPGRSSVDSWKTRFTSTGRPQGGPCLRNRKCSVSAKWRRQQQTAQNLGKVNSNSRAFKKRGMPVCRLRSNETLEPQETPCSSSSSTFSRISSSRAMRPSSCRASRSRSRELARRSTIRSSCSSIL